MSFNTPAANKTWSNDEGFQYELWSDTDRDLAVYYGAAANAQAKIPDRITKILDADGTLIVEYPKVSVGTNPAQVLEDCTILFGP